MAKHFLPVVLPDTPGTDHDMDPLRQLVSDVLALQSITKVTACSFAGIKPSALSHWLNGKPAISPEKLAQVLAFIGLKPFGDGFCFCENEELLSPRVWRVEDKVMESAIRLLGQAQAQFGRLRFGLPTDMRGAAVLFSEDGAFGVVQRCNPILLVGHREEAAWVGPGVIQRILDGDVHALIHTARLLALTGRVDLDALDVADSIRQASLGCEEGAGPESADPGGVLLEWAQVSAQAVRAGLSPQEASEILRRFLALSVSDRALFLGKEGKDVYRYSPGSIPQSLGSS
jgi:hypothetical protein